MGFQLSYFRSWKMMLWKASLNTSANWENSAVATTLEKVSFHSHPKERQCQRMLKRPHNCTHLSRCKVMLKILQARLQQHVNCELADVQAGFGKGRGSRDQITNIRWIIKKGQELQKKHLFLMYCLCQSLWLCGSQKAVGISPWDENSRPPYLPPEKSIYRSRTNT